MTSPMLLSFHSPLHPCSLLCTRPIGEGGTWKVLAGNGVAKGPGEHGDDCPSDVCGRRRAAGRCTIGMISRGSGLRGPLGVVVATGVATVLFTVVVADIPCPVDVAGRFARAGGVEPCVGARSMMRKGILDSAGLISRIVGTVCGIAAGGGRTNNEGEAVVAVAGRLIADLERGGAGSPQGVYSTAPRSWDILLVDDGVQPVAVDGRFLEDG